GKKVAVIGSGPAGMACAQQLARAGHDVHLFEKYAKAGGLLRYGIPDFKMEKVVIDRRVAQMEAEGVTFHYNSHVGVDGNVDPREMLNEYDAVALTGGAEAPRDLAIPGRELDGIHYAMDFLPQQNRRVSSEPLNGVTEILAGGKHVVVIAGTEFDLDADLVLLAMGFVHPVHEGLLKLLSVELDPRGNVKANMLDYQTSRPNVFSAGDMRRGQSLVVWAIREGRLCARSIDTFLMGKTDLPR